MLAPDLDADIHSNTVPSHPEIFALSSDVLVLVWNAGRQIHSSLALTAASGGKIAPMASLRLTLSDGDTRLLWVFRASLAEGKGLLLSAGGSTADMEIQIPHAEALDLLSPRVLLDALPDAGRTTLLNALLNTWPAMFRLNRSRSFTRFMLDFVRNLAADPLPAKVVLRATDEEVVLQTAAPDAIGDIKTTHIIGPEGLSRLRLGWRDAPPQQGRKVLACLLDVTMSQAAKSLLLISGADGVAVRRIEAGTQIPSLGHWWRARRKAAPELREHIIGLLWSGSAAARAAALEFQMACPLPARAVIGRGGLPSCEISLALASRSGVLVGGWFQDDAGIVQGVDIVDAEGAAHPLDASWHRFPGEVPALDDVPAVRATGFVAFAPGIGGGAQILQPQFRLRLASGIARTLVPAQQTADPAKARALALSAIPHQHLTQGALERCLVPAIADFHNEVLGRLGEPTVVRIGQGTEHPVVSLVIPLYRTLDFLRFQIAAFASDPWLRGHAELIYVLDSPEQAEEVEHLLRGLHILFGMPIILAVMARNGGYAPASNAGARLAKGAVLALVNSDVIPVSPGWLGTLAGRIGGKARVGAVGPKLLFEDGAIQHAGMYFAKDAKGNWLNHHYFKGLPRGYASANQARIVPAVTGACLVTPRELFEHVGGFTEDYVIGDYEDSDLCLKIREQGNSVAYVPEAELYHLERRSIRQSADYMRGAASRYNSWMHSLRWDKAMTELMAPSEPASEETEGRAAA